MPQIVVDFSEATDFTPVPEGDYWTTIVKAEIKETKSGLPKITVTMDIQEGEHAGRKLFDDMILQGANALGYTKRKLLAILGDVPEGSFNMDTDDLIGVDVRVRVYHDVWAEEDGGDGQVRAKIAKFFPNTASAAAASAEGGLDDLFN
jgi:hypothetical protein